MAVTGQLGTEMPTEALSTPVGVSEVGRCLSEAVTEVQKGPRMIQQGHIHQWPNRDQMEVPLCGETDFLGP